MVGVALLQLLAIGREQAFGSRGTLGEQFDQSIIINEVYTRLACFEQNFLLLGAKGLVGQLLAQSGQTAFLSGQGGQVETLAHAEVGAVTNGQGRTPQAVVAHLRSFEKDVGALGYLLGFGLGLGRAQAGIILKDGLHDLLDVVLCTAHVAPK